MRTGGAIVLLLIALTVLPVTRGVPQSLSPRSLLEWLAVAVEAESERRHRDAHRAYAQALAFRPLDPALNLTLYRYEGNSDYLLRAAEGLLKEPHTDTEIVQRICDGLMHRDALTERRGPIPLMLLPPQTRKTFVQRFGKWLFPDLLSEAHYRLAEGEQHKAVSLWRQIVLAGEPFALDELFWRLARDRHDYLRYIAAEWERDALKTKNPYLFIAVLNIYRHLNDQASIRRLFPHALAAAQGSRRSRQLLALCMQRIGWKEGMATARAEQEEFGDSPRLLEQQAADAAQRGQVERAKRLVLHYCAEYSWIAPLRQYFATLGWHDLPDSEAGSEADAGTITRMLIRHLNHPDQFRYWLKMAVIQGTQRFPRTSIPEEVLSEYVERNLSPDYQVVIVERILPLLKEMGLPERLLETQTRRLSGARIAAYHQLGYYRLANRLSQQRSERLPSEGAWQAVSVGWQQTVAQDESMAYTVVGAEQDTSRSSRLLGTILHMAHALAKEGRSREASRVASSELSGYPREWREGLARAVAFFDKGIPAIVPFAQWLSKMAATDTALVTNGYLILKSLAGDELAQAVVVTVLAVMPEPKHPTEHMYLDLRSILRPPTPFGLSELDSRQPPSILNPLPPPPRSVGLLAEHLPPQLWGSRFFSRLGSPWLSTYHEPFVRRYPNTAVCVLHRLWQTNRTLGKNAVRQELRALRQARHWHTVDWTRIPPLSETVRSAASKQEAMELLDIVSVHAPKEVRPMLQQQKLILRARPPDAPPLPVQVMLLEEAVWNRPVSLEQKFGAVREITYAAPEAAAVLFEKMLPELLEYDADHPHWNLLFQRYCQTLVDVAEMRPTLAPRLRPLLERAIAQSAVLKRALVFERATLAAMAGKPERAAEYLLQALRQPDSARGGLSWTLLFAALVKLPLSAEGYRQLQAEIEERLSEEQPSLSRIEGALKEIPSYGIDTVYTGGRKTYHGYASEQGLRILAETLTPYVQQFAGVIPLPFVETVVGHARTVYYRDDVAGAAPAWKELMHACLRDILLLSPEDARQLASSMRSMHLPSTNYTWAQAFRRDLEEIITLLQSGGERS